MDQDRVLQTLAHIVAPTGVLAIFGDRSFWDADSEWKRAVRSLIQRFLGESRRAGSDTFRHHNRSYAEILRESSFSKVEEYRIPVQRTWTYETILGYLYSTSFAARHLFGDRVAEFERALATTLATYSDGDTFEEENEFIIRIARKGS